MYSDTLKIELQDQILIIGLNRPEKRNALNDEAILALEQVFDQMPAGIKCAIIYGEALGAYLAGDRRFVRDLSSIKERNAAQGVYHSRMWHRVMDKVQFGPVPVIAAIHGACVGGGLELASSCHIRVADASTFYALPEGQRGIFVGGGAAVRVPKLIGMARMTDMMLTGRVYQAEEGYQIGLAQYFVEEGTGLDKAIELAQKICSNVGMTNFALVQVLPRIVEAGHDNGLMMEALMASIAQDAPEAKQRLVDFLEGRAKKVGE